MSDVLLIEGGIFTKRSPKAKATAAIRASGWQNLAIVYIPFNWVTALWTDLSDLGPFLLPSCLIVWSVKYAAGSPFSQHANQSLLWTDTAMYVNQALAQGTVQQASEGVYNCHCKRTKGAVGRLTDELSQLATAYKQASLDRPPGESRSGELWTQKLKFHLVRTRSLNVLPLNPGIG